VKKRFLIAAVLGGAGLFQAASLPANGDTANMTLEQNKAIVRGYLNEVVNHGNLAAFDTYFSKDVVFNGSGDFKQRLTRLLAVNTAFPDHRLTIEDQIADGDKVATRVTFQGTHQGKFNGIAPTGKVLKYSGLAIDRIADGKVVEMWHTASPLGLLQQITAALSAAPN
jgi:predicted ester cyclase